MVVTIENLQETPAGIQRNAKIAGLSETNVKNIAVGLFIKNVTSKSKDRLRNEIRTKIANRNRANANAARVKTPARATGGRGRGRAVKAALMGMLLASNPAAAAAARGSSSSALAQPQTTTGNYLAQVQNVSIMRPPPKTLATLNRNAYIATVKGVNAWNKKKKTYTRDAIGLYQIKRAIVTNQSVALKNAPTAVKRDMLKEINNKLDPIKANGKLWKQFMVSVTAANIKASANQINMRASTQASARKYNKPSNGTTYANALNTVTPEEAQDIAATVENKKREAHGKVMNVVNDLPLNRANKNALKRQIGAAGPMVIHAIEYVNENSGGDGILTRMKTYGKGIAKALQKVEPSATELSVIETTLAALPRHGNKVVVHNLDLRNYISDLLQNIPQKVLTNAPKSAIRAFNELSQATQAILPEVDVLFAHKLSSAATGKNINLKGTFDQQAFNEILLNKDVTGWFKYTQAVVSELAKGTLFRDPVTGQMYLSSIVIAGLMRAFKVVANRAGAIGSCARAVLNLLDVIMMFLLKQIASVTKFFFTDKSYECIQCMLVIALITKAQTYLPNVAKRTIRKIISMTTGLIGKYVGSKYLILTILITAAVVHGDMMGGMESTGALVSRTTGTFLEQHRSTIARLQIPYLSNMLSVYMLVFAFIPTSLIVRGHRALGYGLYTRGQNRFFPAAAQRRRNREAMGELTN